MQNLMRTTGLLLATSLLLLAPGASALGPSLDLRVDAHASADGAMEAAEDAQARAAAARAELEAKADAARAEAKAHAEAALEKTQAEAHAGASAGADLGERAAGAIQGAFAAIRGFATSIFAKVTVDVKLG